MRSLKQASLPSAMVGAVALSGGVVMARNPPLALAGVALAIVLGLLITLPVRQLATGLLIGTAVMPAILLEARTRGGLFGELHLTGQARLVTALAAVVAVKLVTQRTAVRAPGYVVFAVAAYVGGLLISVATAFVVRNTFPGLVSDIWRQVTYPLALFVGVAVGCDSAGFFQRRAMYRTLAVAGCLVSASSVAYWLWSRGHLSAVPPPFKSAFDYASQVNVYGPSRSIFPFTSDSPNLGAVAFIAIAAFVSPPLLFSGDRRDRRFGWLLVILTAAAVLSTESRTGLIALAVAPLPLVASLPKGPARRRIFTGLVIVTALGVGTYGVLSGRSFSGRAQTFISRQQIWKQAESKFLASPVFGQGYHYSANENFVEAVPNAAYGAPDARLNSVHNEYLGQLVDGGVVGASIFVLVSIAVIRLALQLMRRAMSRSEGVGLLCLLAALAVSDMAGASSESAVVATLFWLFVGIAASVAPSVET